MTIFEGITGAAVSLNDFQAKLVMDHRRRTLEIKLHREKIESLKRNANKQVVDELKQEVQGFKRYLETDNIDSEGMTKIHDYLVQEKSTIGILESDIYRLRNQISELPVGNARDELVLVLERVERFRTPLMQFNELAQALKRILMKLEAIIVKEIEALEREYNILVAIGVKNYSNIDEEIEELIGTVEYLELNLKKEQDTVVEPIKALIDQKRPVIARIAEIRAEFDKKKFKGLDLERVKEDIRSLNPLQAREYMDLLGNIMQHYLTRGGDFRKIRKTWNFITRFRSFFERKRAKIEAQKNIDEARRYDNVSQLARIDPLTGLKNRRAMDEDLKVRIRLLKRKGFTLGFMMIDLDNFKSINSWGHLVGDMALKVVTGAIKEVLREGDNAYRYGGEEIAVLLSNGPTEENLMVIGNRMREIVTTRIEEKKPKNELLAKMGSRRITISVGAVCIFSQPTTNRIEDSVVEQTCLDIIGKADALLDQAKQNGKNQVRIARIDI